jgi:DNA-binding NtrC family response regulator
MSRIQELLHDWMVHNPPTAEPRQSAPAMKVIAITLSPETRALVENVAKNRGWELFCTNSLARALEMKDRATAVALVDREIFGADSKEALAGFLQPPHRCCVILMTPNRTERFCYDFIKHGGYSVLVTPLQPAELAEAVRLAAAFWKACISRRAATTAG